MKLKYLLNEMEPQDADFNAKEEADNKAMADDIEKYDGKEVTIIVNDSATVTALIGFDKNNYVVLSKLSIEDNDDNINIDLKKVKEEAEKKLDKDLSNEIEVSI